MRVGGMTIEKIEMIDTFVVAIFYRNEFGQLFRREAWAGFGECSLGLEGIFSWGANEPVEIVQPQAPEGAR